MPEMTQHIGLKKPLESETADISVINENMDKIDSALGDLAVVPTTAKDTAGAITELFVALENADVPDATLTTKGKVQLSNATNSIAEDRAATTRAVKDAMDAASGASGSLTTHANSANVHSATSAATASRLIIRDAAGRAKVTAPATSDDIARLDSITKAQAGLGSVDNYGTATQVEAESGMTANKFMTPQRTKQYVDKRLLNNISWRINNGHPEWSNDAGATWKGVGDDMGKYPNMHIVAGLPPTSLTAVVSVTNKAGYLDRAAMAYSNVTGNGLRLRVTIDGVVVFDNTFNISTGSLLSGVFTTGQGAARMPNSPGGAGASGAVISAPYPYIGTDPAACFLPNKLFFKNSLVVEMSRGSASGGTAAFYSYEVGYAVE